MSRFNPPCKLLMNRVRRQDHLGMESIDFLNGDAESLQSAFEINFKAYGIHRWIKFKLSTFLKSYVNCELLRNHKIIWATWTLILTEILPILRRAYSASLLSLQYVFGAFSLSDLSWKALTVHLFTVTF